MADEDLCSVVSRATEPALDVAAAEFDATWRAAFTSALDADCARALFGAPHDDARRAAPLFLWYCIFTF